MNELNRKKLRKLKRNLNLLLNFYDAKELENTIFDVFEEANLHSDLTYEEKEKRKMLHEALREIFRSAAH